MASTLPILLAIAPIVLLALLSRKCRAVEVLQNLEETPPEESSLQQTKRPVKEAEDLAQAGFLTAEEQRNFMRSQRTTICCVVAVFAALAIASSTPLTCLVPAAVLGLALGYLATRYRLSSAKRAHARRIEFHLPIVMEHLVMAAESGLDIIPAVGAILELDRRQAFSGTNSEKDPVIRLLEKVHTLSQAGVPFERALHETASDQSCNAVRHAFVHLGLAQKEGGEIMGPLRELSDATQLYYQESVEEEIAQMPVRATMPLVLTFAGLILFFISAPIVQILSIAENAKIPTGGFNDTP